MAWDRGGHGLQLGRLRSGAAQPREERERRFEDAVRAYEAGRITATEARIRAGLATRNARLAYRFPRLLGRLCPFSAADRLRPVYYPFDGTDVVLAQPPRPEE